MDSNLEILIFKDLIQGLLGNSCSVLLTNLVRNNHNENSHNLLKLIDLKDSFVKENQSLIFLTAQKIDVWIILTFFL